MDKVLCEVQSWQATKISKVFPMLNQFWGRQITESHYKSDHEREMEKTKQKWTKRTVITEGKKKFF